MNTCDRCGETFDCPAGADWFQQRMCGICFDRFVMDMERDYFPDPEPLIVEAMP